MNFLVLYGTTEGQTRKISAFVGERIRSRGHSTTVIDATDPETEYLKVRSCSSQSPNDQPTELTVGKRAREDRCCRQSAANGEGGAP